MLVHRSLEVIVAGDVRLQRRSVRGNNVMRFDFRAAAAVVELEGRIDMPTRSVGVHFTSSTSAVAHDGVAKCLQGNRVSGPEEGDNEEENGGGNVTKPEHG